MTRPVFSWDPITDEDAYNKVKAPDWYPWRRDEHDEDEVARYRRRYKEERDDYYTGEDYD